MLNYAHVHRFKIIHGKQLFYLHNFNTHIDSINLNKFKINTRFKFLMLSCTNIPSFLVLFVFWIWRLRLYKDKLTFDTKHTPLLRIIHRYSFNFLLNMLDKISMKFVTILQLFVKSIDWSNNFALIIIIYYDHRRKNIN